MEVFARVSWISPENGGRARLPSSLDYSTVSRWAAQSDADWQREAWSVTLRFERLPFLEGPNPAKLCFLSNKAPAAWLYPGNTCGLYEGAKKVADVEILARPA